MNRQDVVLAHTNLLYSIHCNFASVDFCFVLLQQNIFREFTKAFFTDGGSQLVWQVLHSTLKLLYFSWVKVQLPSTVTRRTRKSPFDLKLFNMALHTDALVCIC